MTTTVTVAEARAFAGSLAALAVNVNATTEGMSASAAYTAIEAIIHNAIAEQHPGVNFGAFSNMNKRHELTVALDDNVALAGAYACRNVVSKSTGDEWPAVARIIGV